MIDSRDPAELLPVVREKLEGMLAAATEAGIKLIITSTYRDNEFQDKLYAMGRSQPGRKVTNARGGESMHNHRIAFDVAPVIGGKVIWDDNSLWSAIGTLGIAQGLEWGGNWKFQDKPHFQYKQALTKPV